MKRICAVVLNTKKCMREGERVGERDGRKSGKRVSKKIM